MKFRFLATLLLAALSTVGRSAETPDARFEAAANSFIERYLAFSPVEATQLGDHRFDDRMPDFSAAARLERVKACRALLSELEQLKPATLAKENGVDLKILRLNVESLVFSEEELKEWSWNPLNYNETLSSSIYLLTAREFAPAEQRLKSAEARLALFPQVIAQAKANLQHPPKIHTEITIKQLAGTIGLVREGLAELLATASPERRKSFSAAQQSALKALEEFKAWMEKDLLPRADGNFRIGSDLFQKKLRFSLDSDLSQVEVLARAEADLRATQAAMFETARPLFHLLFPGKTEAEIEALGVKPLCRAVLAKLADRHPTNDTIVPAAEKGLVQITEFVRKQDLVRVPTEPLRLIVMPEFKRGVIIAYCDSPGPLEKNAETFYAISPTPSDWKPERAESFYREYNDYGLQELSIHEAMPGHYLQGAHSNAFRAPTLVRAVFSSGTMVEGWACYAEQVLAELGYGGPEVKMHQLKMRLRLIINAIIDQKIHTGTMTEQEALDLMIQDGFQEEGEAVAKWTRARLTSTQLSTYFVGTTEMLDLRAAAQKKAGPGFKYRTYHDELLAHGSPAPRYLRELLGF